MTRVYNAEHGFKDEYLEGLTAAYGRFLRRVPGASAVMSVDAPVSGQVSVVTGGGSGHYPAFGGLVGPGLCHGAVIGEVFTSPSAVQALRCIRAVDGGAGVLFAFGNYSGDVMHFGAAAEQASAEGIDTRIVLVTDDVASAPATRAADRRGIAGGFFVFRAASSQARTGAALQDVERVARAVNDRTRTFGVAFAGCTFPGRSEPLFRIDAGRIALGLGIHGEPGIETIDWVPADELAGVLVRPLLDERPHDGVRARVLVNGLGSTKYEELFVLYRSVHRLLEAEGIETVEPEVGEFVTSLDMAGCSLTLCWIDDEMETLLATPAASPGYRTGGSMRATGAAPPADRAHDPPIIDKSVPWSLLPQPGSDPTPAARAVADALGRAAAAVADAEAELGRLDSIAGDGDHGAGMVRGLRSAAGAAAHTPTAGAALVAAGEAFADAAGGASGALWGAGLMAAGRVLADARSRGDEASTDPPDAATLRQALASARDVVIRLGGARVGDKTLVDVLVPFVDAFDAAGDVSVADAWRAALPAAIAAADRTASLAARKGRASVHGDRSIGTVDPGARSLAICLAAMADSLDACRGGHGHIDGGDEPQQPAVVDGGS